MKKLLILICILILCVGCSKKEITLDENIFNEVEFKFNENQGHEYIYFYNNSDYTIFNPSASVQYYDKDNNETLYSTFKLDYDNKDTLIEPNQKVELHDSLFYSNFEDNIYKYKIQEFRFNVYKDNKEFFCINYGNGHYYIYNQTDKKSYKN